MANTKTAAQLLAEINDHMAEMEARRRALAVASRQLAAVLSDGSAPAVESAPVAKASPAVPALKRARRARAGAEAAPRPATSEAAQIRAEAARLGVTVSPPRSGRSGGLTPEDRAAVAAAQVGELTARREASDAGAPVRAEIPTEAPPAEAVTEVPPAEIPDNGKPSEAEVAAPKRARRGRPTPTPTLPPVAAPVESDSDALEF